MLPTGVVQKRLCFAALTVIVLVRALGFHTRFFSGKEVRKETYLVGTFPTQYHQQQAPLLVIDILSVGSLQRPEFQDAQESTFARHPSVRNFTRVTERDDVDQDCNAKLTWWDVQAISGFCGGLRKQVKTTHPLLYDLRIKYANTGWLNRTKSNPMAWICAQKRPMAGLQKVLQMYNDRKGLPPTLVLPDYLIIMDDDTYYNMESVTNYLLSFQKEYHLDRYDAAIGGCMIRGRLEKFKFTFPFGGWGTIFGRGVLQNIMQPLFCQEQLNVIDHSGGTRQYTMSGDSSSLGSATSATVCKQLQRDRIGEYHLFKDGLSLADIMYEYVMKEPYADHQQWQLGFCLHSDWVWGYMVNYFNISIPLGRRRDKLKTDRFGAIRGSEINPPYGESVLRLRRECDHNSDRNCTKDAYICHYVTPEHMRYLWVQTQTSAGQ